MRLLLDTHAFLWFAWGSSQLSSMARSLIENPANQKLVSLVGLWEIAVKVSVGKLTLAKPIGEFLAEHLDGNGFDILPIERSHVIRVADLPWHHRDPFDRLLISQCLAEALPLISADALFDAYGISRLW